jgi:hypothetical protein
MRIEIGSSRTGRRSVNHCTRCSGDKHLHIIDSSRYLFVDVENRKRILFRRILISCQLEEPDGKEEHDVHVDILLRMSVMDR